MAFKPGSEIWIPCDVKPGPFSGEHLISILSKSGAVTGFMRQSELRKIDGDWFVRAVVRAQKDDALEVGIEGSFFTTNGIATISRDIARAA